MIKVRDIVNANRLPRRLNVQPNLFLDKTTHEIKYEDYPETHEGIIRSFVERYPDSFQADVWNQWVSDEGHFRYP